MNYKTACELLILELWNNKHNNEYIKDYVIVDFLNNQNNIHTPQESVKLVLDKMILKYLV